jgi:hypothetical protein
MVGRLFISNFRNSGAEVLCYATSDTRLQTRGEPAGLVLTVILRVAFPGAVERDRIWVRVRFADSENDVPGSTSSSTHMTQQLALMHYKL